MKIGRNDPCPCGSGKKYKLCHGRLGVHSTLQPVRQQTSPVAHGRAGQQEAHTLSILFNERRYAEMATLAQNMTKCFPLDGLGWKALGAAYSLMGRSADALAPMQKAVMLLPDDANLHYNLSNALQMLGKLEEAELSCRRALQIKPDYADAHYSLSIILQDMGRLEEAEAGYRRMLQIKPDHAQAHTNLGTVLHELGRLDEAKENYQQALQIKPDYADAYYNLGITLHRLEKRDEAEASYRQALQLKPDFAEAHCNLGITLRELGRLDEAEASFRRALEIKPNYTEAHNNLGNTFKDMQRLNEAITSYLHALQIKPDCAESHSNLGVALRGFGCLAEAETSYRRALEIRPDYVEAHNGLGCLLEEQGNLTEAEASFRRALEIKPDFLAARMELASIKKIKASDENMAALIAIDEAVRNDAKPLSAKDAAYLHFALGKCYDDLGDYEKAFPHFLEGNKVKRATFDYNPDRIAEIFALIMRNFDASSIGGLCGGGDFSRLPIFVLGMPRSGTTLTEQIIASHPEVHGAGELPDLMAIAMRDMGGAAFPDNLRSLDRARLTAWGAEYVAGLQRRAPVMGRITDKMPENFLAVGLIHLMLPNAKIIHVNRNPVDTCLSCFSKLFTFGQKYTFDLAELGRYYVGYAHLMEHWRKVLPEGALLDVRYEDIVADQEAQSRRIIEYCGLEWDDDCLDFHRNKRAVRTASLAQVRQPMYKSSVERWRHYEKFLGPLFDALGELASDR